MSERRIILELGMGNDLHGGDYTKAALRAVSDALHHSSMMFLRSMQIDPESMRIHVTIGVQRPDKVDADRVRQALPHGAAEVSVVKGGLDVEDAEANDPAVIASAAVAVHVETGYAL